MNEFETSLTRIQISHKLLPFVFDEVATLTQARLGQRTALLVGKTLLDPKLATLLHITPSDEKASWKLFEKRADKSCSFTDCTSFIVMRRQKVKMAPTFDHHFAQEGFHVAPE
mgnify:CR=1 FL=1